MPWNLYPFSALLPDLQHMLLVTEVGMERLKMTCDVAQEQSMN